MKIKKGDNVIVTKGKDRGKKGAVVRTIDGANQVVIEGVNIKQKHERSRERGKKGQVITLPMPINAANVMILDPKSGKASRVGYKIEDGKKIRIARKSGQKI